MERDRVLVLIKGLGRGGAEQLLLSAAPYLDRERFGYEFAYVLPWKDALVHELESLGYDVHLLGPGRSWPVRLRRLVKERGMRLVHAHSPLVAIEARAALPRRTRLVYTEHNVWERYHSATYWANLLTYRRNDHVFCVSQDVHRSVRNPKALEWMRMPRKETLHHGLDFEAIASAAAPDGVRAEFGIGESVPIVGTVANLKPHKGLQYLLDAAIEVRKEIPDVRFLLIGVGPLEDEIRAAIRDRQLEDTLTLTGFREDVPRLAAAFDLFVMPSIHEGLSIALLEAMSLGKPAVVTNVGGLPEVIQDGREGYLVPPARPDLLAGRILDVLTDETQRARLGVAARERAGAFDIRNAVARMETVYEELLR